MEVEPRTQRPRTQPGKPQAAGAPPVRGPATKGSAVRGQEGPPTLTDAQLGAAQAWYVSRAAQYTPRVFRAIQQRLGLPVSGRADAATLQGIARWQASHRPLPIAGERGVFRVDGKVGPDLLEQLLPQGLARPREMQTFAADFGRVAQQWSKWSPQKRATALTTTVNRALKSAGVPAVGLHPAQFQDLTKGTFDAQEWRLIVRQSLLSRRDLSPQDAAELAETLYHEARHAEQIFKIARLKVSGGVDQPMLNGLPERVVDAAQRRPVPPGSVEGIEAEGYFQSSYGTGATQGLINDETIRAASARKNELEAAMAQADQHLSALNKKKLGTVSFPQQSELDQQIARWTRFRQANAQERLRLIPRLQNALRTYRQQPEEADAWRVGGAFRKVYGQARPTKGRRE